MNPEPINPDNAREICFEAERGVKIADKILALILGSAIFLLNLLFAFVLSLVLKDVAKLPVPAIIPIATIFFFLGLHSCWRLICLKLRFCIILKSNHIQVGRGWAKCRFTYGDVDLIDGSLTNNGGCVRLKCGRKSARVFLPSASHIECVKLLRRCCINAVFVDWQQEYLPQNPTHPAKTLTALEGHYRKRCIFFLLMTIIIILVLADLFWNFWQWRQGKLNPNLFEKFLLMRLILLWPIFPILVVTGAVSSWKSWKTAIEVRDRRLRFQDETRPEI